MGIEKYILSGVRTLFSIFKPEPVPPRRNEEPGTARKWDRHALRALERSRSETPPPLPSILLDGTIEQRIFPNLEHGPLEAVNGIVLHQTSSGTAEDTFNAYRGRPKNEGTGSHFLIDRNGQIYQTASLDQVAWHVGRLRSRETEVKTCSKKEYDQNGPVVNNPEAMHRKEMLKEYPSRFPSNKDSVGIEVVAKFDEKRNEFERPTEDQLRSIHSLIEALKEKFSLTGKDVYRHGGISYKEVSEGCGLGYD